MATQFYSCFISYSTKDQEFADRLHADLQANGIRCWFAPSDLDAGRKVHEQIDEAIRTYDKLLLVLSDASMNSGWVRTEISKARKRELRENRRLLFPISLVPLDQIRDWKQFDANTGTDLGREIREYFIPDFSNWRDRYSYVKSLDRLLLDLRADPLSEDVLGSESVGLSVTFAPGIGPDVAREVLSALADYYRVCGGAGFRVDAELADVLIEEPVDVVG